MAMEFAGRGPGSIMIFNGQRPLKRSSTMNRAFAFVAAVLLTSLPAPAGAEQSKTFGDYTIHYSAFTTDILAPDIAKNSQITRSKNRALLNISVLKKVMGTTGQPVRAAVKATATNLSAQLQELKVRELDEHGAIYYLAETGIGNEETLKYSVSVVPEGETTPFEFSFDQQFFTE